MKVPVASLRRIRAGLVAAALLSAPALHAQDVLRQGRAHGVEAPAWITETLREQPGAFEFRRAWRNKVEGVRQERRRLEGARTGPLMSTGQMQAYGAAVTGTLRVPVIAARYSDRAAPYPAADYQARLFGDGAAGAYTAKSFYREMSRGAFTLDGTVSGWVALPQQAAFYEPSASTSARYGRTFEFLRDALAGADPTVNFGQFDNDGPDGVPNSGDDDGYVDAAAFLYPAAGANCGGPGIWPHRYVYSAYNGGVPFSTDDASARGGTIKVDDYLIQGGLECDGASLMDIGTFAHEMGHALALPDLYDTRGTTSGLGEWDLMASGNYRTPASPAHMSAWSKDFLGWVNVETVFGSYPAVTLAPVYEGGRVLRYDIPGTREYFLLEHRRAFGSDADIRAPGLLVYHVDEGVVEAARVSNEVNAGAVHGVALVEADGLGHLSGGANRGDAGDVFPGALLQTSFGEGTSPGSRGNGGLPSGFSLSGIQYTADVLTFTMQAGGPANAVASVSVTPAAPGIAVGTTQQLVATLRDAAGALVTGPAVTWSSSSPGIVSVTSRGLAQGLAAGGPVTITATAGGASGTASVTVTAALQAVTLTSGVPVAGISGTVGSDRLFRIAVPEGATSLGVSTSGGTGNANLYVRRGAPPLPADCLSVSGSSTEFCGFLNPAAGDWYILVRTEGSYTGLTLTASVAGTLALGDSASGAIGTGAGGQRFPLVLTAGDVIDVGAFRTGGLSAFTPYVELYAPSGSRVALSTVRRAAPAGWILARYTVPETGTYSVRVIDRRSTNDLNRYSGTFRVRTRRSGVVLAVDGEIEPRYLPAGSGVVRDSVWVYNAGAPGSATFAAAAVRGSPWLTVSSLGSITAASGRAPAGDADAPQAVPPSGAVPVEAVLAPGALAEGHHPDGVAIAIPGDVWNEGMQAAVDLRLHSAAARIINQTLSALPGTLARAADGRLVMASGSGLVRIDPATGQSTPWVTGLSAQLGGMEFTADGVLYVVDALRQRVLRVVPDGTWTVAMTTTVAVNEVAVLPDGRVFASAGSNLVRLVPGGAPVTVVAGVRTRFAEAMVFNPADGWLYYSTTGGLRRYNPSTGADEARGTGPALLTLEVGRSGRLYGTENAPFGGIVVMETTGAVVERFWAPGVGNGLVMGDGMLVGSSTVPGSQVWTLPVQDRAMSSGGISGDPSGDGAITAQDALGVLSVVVGRALPVGWEVQIAGDANCDGQVTAVDALIILSKVVGRDVSQFCIGTRR